MSEPTWEAIAQTLLSPLQDVAALQLQLLKAPFLPLDRGAEGFLLQQAFTKALNVLRSSLLKLYKLKFLKLSEGFVSKQRAP